MYPLYILLIALTISNTLSTPIDIRANTTEDYRLPQIYQLSNYQIDLKVPAASFTNSSNEYNGTVTIEFSFTNTSDYIALHAFNDTIRLNSISFDNTAIDGARYAINNVTNILRINLTTAISGTSSHKLVIDFTGQLSTTIMYGFYKSSYVDKNGVTKYLATTQFEPTHARRAFPCFDEPSFKATFDVSITYPSTMNVLFNTKADLISNNGTGIITTKFATTPKMSSYLIAFIISEFTCTSGDTVDTVPTQVCSRNESSGTRKLAVEVGARVLEKLNNFTNYNYNLTVSKMDQVAIPDFNAGAMENWGLVTYRETALLWDETESSNRYKQRVATVIAHEFAHQWFGDLVTCKWWSEIFLNEGFARYFEYFITHEVFPTWELDKQFVVEQLHAVFGSDASDNVQALQSDCSTPTEISNKFGTISYSKGASVLRMLSHFLGVTNFKTGLQKYLRDNNHSSVEPEDLWRALNSTIASANIKIPADIATVMDNWIKKSGFPLLTVKSNGNNITVTQERFLVSGEDNGTQWYVPVTYTTSNDSNKFQNTTPSAWLSPSGNITINLPTNSTWIILNNQETGYYRVNYDDSLWDEIGAALVRDNFDGITEINRAQIVDDLFSLARVSKIEYSSVFHLTRFLANDSSYYPWYPAFSGYNFVLGKVGESSSLGNAISSTVLTLMKNLYDSVPFSKLDEDDQIYTHKQVLALTWACRLGSEDCVTVTRSLYNTFKTTNVRPNKNLRALVYCNGVRYSNDSSDWDLLWNTYLNSSDLATEQVTILSTLGCSRNASLLKGYLQKIITDGSGIRLQDASSAFSAVYDRNPEGLAVAYDFVTENYQNISTRFNNVNSPGNILKDIAGQFTTEAQVNKLKVFAASANLPEVLKTAANEAVETAESNLKWLTQFKDDLERYYGVSGVSRSSASVLITVLAIILCNFVFY